MTRRIPASKTSLVKPGGNLGELAKIRGGRGLVLPIVKEVLLANSGPDPSRNPHIIHPSEMAKADWCIRATWYRISGYPEPAEKFSPVLENIFEEGNYIHAKYQDLLRQSGRLWGRWKCLSCKIVWTGISGELPGGCHMDFFPDASLDHIWRYDEVDLNLPGSIKGKADGGIDDSLVEFKSIGLGTLRIDAPNLLKRHYHHEIGVYDLDKVWKELTRPLPSHNRQGQIYLWLAREMGLLFTKMRFVYEFKANQLTKEFTVTLAMDIVQPLLDKAEKIIHGLEYNRPPKCESGGCKHCGAYEKEIADAESKGTEYRSATRRVSTRGGSESRSAGSGAPGSPRRRSTAVTRGSDRPCGLRADEAVPEYQRVGAILAGPVVHGGGRRKVRG